MNPKRMFIYSGMVYRIRPQGLQILTPTFFQHFQEVRNTVWFIAVPSKEHRCMIEGWVKRGVIAQLIPFEKDFQPLSGVPRITTVRYHLPTRKRDERQISPNEILDMYLGGHTTVHNSVITIEI